MAAPSARSCFRIVKSPVNALKRKVDQAEREKSTVNMAGLRGV
jgi:hypothetical protein